MDLATRYKLPVPSDALTEVDTAGVLGQSFVTIDASQASGPPIENFGYLKSKPTRRALSLEDTLTAARALLELDAAQRAAEKAPRNNLPASRHPPKP